MREVWNGTIQDIQEPKILFQRSDKARDEIWLPTSFQLSESMREKLVELTVELRDPPVYQSHLVATDIRFT